MAFDGITVAALTDELSQKLLGARVYKIAQPEKDELLLTLKNNGESYRMVMSADASLPLLYLTEENKKSPMTAPNFCMLLRKHIQNGRITKIAQPGLERVVSFEIEHLDEMGDLRHKILAIELMGKHSNIIFYDEENKILDSIKHISGMVSSVREVLPGKTYFIPQAEGKADPYEILDMTEETFSELLTSKAMPCFKAIYSGFIGFSPIFAQEMCYRTKIDADLPSSVLTMEQKRNLLLTLKQAMNAIVEHQFVPQIIYDHKTPVEFSVLPMQIYAENEITMNASVSEMLLQYYEEKSVQTRIRQKSVDLRKIVTTALERNVKKYDLQLKQLKDTEKREKYKIYGELLHTYGYEAKDGDKSITVLNYYTNEELTIPLNPEKTAMENAAAYFDKYGKLKRTNEALTEFTRQTKEEIDHLESVLNSMEIAQTEDDLKQIKEELIQSGLIRYKGGKKKEKLISKPLHFISCDGFDIYVGKNNLQNEEITFQLANGNDWWFHAKGMPGSHVVVKNGGKEMSDEAFEEAGRLAAHFSKGKGTDKVEIDYIEKKHVKKPNGSKPGFVVYYTNYSLVIDSDISGIKQVKD